MFLIDFLKKIFGERKNTNKERAEIELGGSIYQEEKEPEQIHSVWDYIKLNDHTQAAHITAVLGFEEWISMDEILRRIKELFNMDYKNDRSLYPYIKTLVDIGLVETNNVGGKKKWRKRDILIKITLKKKKPEEDEDSRASEAERTATT